MSMTLIFATWFQPEWARCVASWNHPALLVPKMGIVPAYQKAFEQCSSDILGYLHDDLVCEESGWKERVLREFDDPAVSVVGFAGAPGFCHPGMKAFHPQAMGRIGFRSNLSNAEVHGARFSGSCEVTVLDGLALFVRHAALREIGGWPVGIPIDYFMYAEWLCCAVRRKGYRVRMVGVSCNHLGGRTTGYNPNLNPDWRTEHEAIWEEFSKDGTIPAMVES
jgi:hypothetical protein